MNGQAAYELWAQVMATNGVDCDPFGKLGNVEQMAWREVEAGLSYEPGSVDIPSGERDVTEFTLAARQPQTAPGDAEVAYEQWIERRGTASVGSMAGFTAGWQEALIAVGGWPRCPNGCGCRLGTEDADARDCACDGLCCYDEIEVSEVFAERDRFKAALAARQPQPVPGPCPGCESLRHQCSELAGEVGALAGTLTEIRDNDHPYGSYSRVLARGALDRLHGEPEPQPAPELLPPRRPGAVYTPDGKYEIPQPAPGDASAIVDTAVKEWLDRRTATALATAPGIDDREQGKRQGIEQMRYLHLDDYWYTLTPAILEALAARQPQPAPGCPDPSQHRDVYGRPLPDTMPQPVPGETELRRRIEDVARGLDHRVSAGSRTRMAVASSSLARILRDILAETAAGPEPQAAPELAGSVVRVISTAPELREAMAESRRYREALESVRAIVLEGDNSTEGSRLRRSRAVIRAALEGK